MCAFAPPPHPPKYSYPIALFHCFLQVLYGSVLHLLVHYILPSTPERNLATVWKEILHQYKTLEVKNTYSSMKLTMFGARGGCKLKGTAAELRDFGKALLPVWRHHANNKLELHRKVELVLKLGNHMEWILDEHPTDFALPGDLHVFPQP